MKRRSVEFCEVEEIIGNRSREGYRLKFERVEVDIPRGFDAEEVLALLALVKEAEL